HGLPIHDKKDSTGICFIGERPFREFLNRYLPKNPGAMETPDGEVVGEHMGLMYYTLGQRQGLGIGGKGEAWYVAAKDMARNVLVVVQGHDHPALFRQKLTSTRLSWVSARAPHCNWVYCAKTRYRQADAACCISQVDENSCRIEFAEPQWAVTPGQSVVIYESKVCLGGGIIEA
ncbi:MAG: tRNA methyl transferase PRC-barrel domain-containing protein, partial [Burkholderiales bacterium]